MGHGPWTMRIERSVRAADLEHPAQRKQRRKRQRRRERDTERDRERGREKEREEGRGEMKKREAAPADSSRHGLCLCSFLTSLFFLILFYVSFIKVTVTNCIFFCILQIHFHNP